MDRPLYYRNPQDAYEDGHEQALNNDLTQDVVHYTGEALENLYSFGSTNEYREAYNSGYENGVEEREEKDKLF
jgi:hypothetical protein